jgi:hypothetical protein
MRGELLNAVAIAVALVALTFSSAGCSSISTCSRDEDHIDVDGYVNADRTMYTSVEPAGQAADGGELSVDELQMLQPYTHFPPNRSITFHIRLVDIPTDIHTFLSFRKDRDATLAPCAGNQCLIKHYSRDEIVIRNDTCSEFWVLLTASTSATPFHALTDAGAAGGASGGEPSDTAGAAGAL